MTSSEPASEPGDCPRDVLAPLRARYPDAPFLALGQTVFWDEPVKAVLRKLLDDNALGGRMVLGVHDTDYFAKARVPHEGAGRFVLMPHNDGTTKSLWSAAGEISTLFGSETFPSRHDYARAGVAFRRLARAHPDGPQAFLDSMTEAWGWRGLVYTGARDLIVHYLPLKDVGAGVLNMLRWGFDNALAQVVPGCCQDEAQIATDTVLEWCQAYMQAHPDKSLSDLFQHVLPKMAERLLGAAPQDTTVACTADLLRLCPETASLPRFKFVDLFLNPQTRDIAIDAYNKALAGSEMYTLDRFGAGALPFDIILPDRGRGTLRVTSRVLFIETRQPIAIALKKPIESVADLAEILCRNLGDCVTLVGKAVTLVSMLAQEFIFVFNEEGSLYVTRTRQMNDMLAAQGVALDMRPILRMRYHTWDALGAAKSTLRPAPHLAATFGQATITAPDFAAQWRQVLEDQRSLCRHIATLRKPLELLIFLQTHDAGGPWEERLRAYQAARHSLRVAREKTEALHWHARALYGAVTQLAQRANTAQHDKGAHFRGVSEWTPNEIARRAAYDGELKAIRLQTRILRNEIANVKRKRLALERDEETTRLRGIIADIEHEAEAARLRLTRNALLTIEGLAHTNHRPSVWWLPLLDPSGDWFRRIADTTELYTEPLLTDKGTGNREQGTVAAL